MHTLGLDTTANAVYILHMDEQTNPTLAHQNILIERVPVEVLEAIGEQARREQRSRASLIRIILANYARRIAKQ